MVVSLNEYADLLYFAPKVPEGYFRAGYEKRAVLLPMKACKVLVPYPKEDALNLFQETILKLLNCGAKEERWLAEKLALDSALVAAVIKELHERKLITASRNITETGRQLLEDETLAYDMKTGYVFYDYVSKSYMDAFVPDSKYNPSEIRSRKKDTGTIQFFFDSTDPNSSYETAVIIHADRPETDIRPSAYDVLKVCRKQRNRERMLFAGNQAESSGDEEMARFAHSEKVSLLGDNKDVYVATYLVIPTADIVNKSRMQVLYPFGEGFSSQLMEPIEKSCALPENDSLKKMIEELKNRQTSMTENEKRSSRTYGEDTVKRVDKVFSGKIRNYPYVHRRVLEVESKKENILRLMKENKGKNWETINSNINDYILAVYRALGAALIDVASKNDYYVDILNKDQKHNADTLTAIALQCGFNDKEDTFARYFRVKKGRVTGSNGQEGAKTSEEVCALIALNLLEARDNAAHPLYALARVMPGFITEAEKLTGLRDEGMHGNDIEYNFKLVEGLGRLFFQAIAVLLELPFDGKMLELNEIKMVDENSIRHRKAAENQVERLFTRGIHRYSGLNNKLVELIEEQNYGEEYLNDTDKGGIGRNGESYPTYVAEVLELILKELCRHRLEKKALSKLEAYTDEYGQTILAQMQENGFQVNAIPYYSLDKISQSFRNYKKGTMQSNFYVWYFSEMEQPDNMLPELAGAAPHLIQLISDAVAARNHTGVMEYHNASLSFIKEQLIGCVNSVIDLMVRRGLY